MYIPSAEMGEYDSVKPPPQKRMSSKQLLEAKYGSGSIDRQAFKGNMTGTGTENTVDVHSVPKKMSHFVELKPYKVRHFLGDTVY